MTCCGRCKICRSEWEEIEEDRDTAKREEDRLRQEINITWDILASGGVMCRELATQASGVMAYQKALEGRIEALLDLISDARPYLTNAKFMRPSDDEVEITRRMDRELAPRRASNTTISCQPSIAAIDGSQNPKA
jgi:hypothetical protein